MSQDRAAVKIVVRGIVQGVGFRPFVYSLAMRSKLTGWVRNTSNGVELVLNGPQPSLDDFISHLSHNPPPLARIDTLKVESVEPDSYTTFEIIESQPREGDFLPISPDTTICPDCQREMFDPKDRRFRYPFINCTNCGPRFSIIQDIPYDRPKTTMAPFAMCSECRREYEQPLDRRFHAQPVACPECGPQIWFESSGQRIGEREDALQIARQWLKDGKILGIKGLGGFHLACDASNTESLKELRRRKKRSDKAFALMAFSIDTILKHCIVSAEEQSLLGSSAHPIVLLDRRPTSTLAPDTAPGQNTLGFMLPYTPLHLLLLEPEPGFPEVFVMTSANLAEEPIAYRDQDARSRLSSLADGFLLHNRDIHMRVDDSVVRVTRHGFYPIRRARGYSPNPIRLPHAVPPILAAGAELKNTFCLTRDDYAFLSHHIGDLENYETLQSFEEGITHYERLFRITPEAIACDLHPNYLATRYAQERAARESLPIITVQHHHAHLAACLADNGWDSIEPVIGVSLDGTGYGPDGAIWGCEFLLGNYQGFERLAHLKYVPLPGGDLAIKTVSRMALAHLWAAGQDWETDLPPVQALCAEERTVLKAQLSKGINSPLTSSMGRLFDAASALLGVRQTATYEGQAAIELENLCDPAETGFYPLEVRQSEIDPQGLWEGLLHDWRGGVALPLLAARFHNSIIRIVLDTCKSIREKTEVRHVALSGGVWQNKFLFERTIRELEQAGFIVLSHRQTPANDGGIALGQALIAAASINP